MSKKMISLLLLLVGFWVSANAQEDSKIIVKGKIVDAKTGEPVAFANLGLLGTVAGVASDMEGYFELTVPDRYATHKIRVSAVGYGPAEMKIYEATGKPDLVIKLKPVTYGIGEVDVYGQLLVYKKMLQNVVNNIGRNYIDQPYNYEGYFKYGIRTDAQDKLKEATVLIYDAQGYHRKDVASAFKAIHYRFNEVRRNQEPVSVLDGLTCLDDILTADVVRNTRNVLDVVNSRDYKLKNKGKMVYEGDSVQIISYTADRPALSTTGDAGVKTYSGEIYVNLKNFAVLKNVVHITSKDFNALGRNLITVGETPKSDVAMTITTAYKKIGNSPYFLSGATIEYTYEEKGKEVKGEMEYITTRVETQNPVAIEGRMYYEDIKVNEDFWNRYSVYFSGMN